MSSHVPEAQGRKDQGVATPSNKCSGATAIHSSRQQEAPHQMPYKAGLFTVGDCGWYSGLHREPMLFPLSGLNQEGTSSVSVKLEPRL